MGASAAETDAMRRALALAADPVARHEPNPRVGCVLLDPDGREVGAGFHRGAGTPHAEVVALDDAGERARGATAVVTLEPCAHTGRTGPCTEALRAAGVSRVVFAQADPNPEAAGGAEALRAVGIDVVGGVLAEEAAALNEAWAFAVRHGRPFLTWKAAATLDGRVGAADGTSRWITGAEARADVHALRAEVGAVVVGTGTVLADDPHLTVRRDGRVSGPQPLRVVVGERAVPPGARVLDDAAETLVLRTRDLDEVVSALAAREVRHALLEGGPTLAAAFVAGGLVDAVRWYVAPALLGEGPVALAPAGMSTISEALRLTVRDVTRVGTDIRIDARVPRAAEEA